MRKVFMKVAFGAVLALGAIPVSAKTEKEHPQTSAPKRFEGLVICKASVDIIDGKPKGPPRLRDCSAIPLVEPQRKPGADPAASI